MEIGRCRGGKGRERKPMRWDGAGAMWGGAGRYGDGVGVGDSDSDGDGDVDGEGDSGNE